MTPTTNPPTNTRKRQRLKVGRGWPPSEFKGMIAQTLVHESNHRIMVNLKFERPEHEALWGGAWFYLDDIEEAE